MTNVFVHLHDACLFIVLYCCFRNVETKEKQFKIYLKLYIYILSISTYQIQHHPFCCMYFRQKRSNYLSIYYSQTSNPIRARQLFIPALIGNYDQRTNQPTDGHGGSYGSCTSRIENRKKIKRKIHNVLAFKKYNFLIF